MGRKKNKRGKRNKGKAPCETNTQHADTETGTTNDEEASTLRHHSHDLDEQASIDNMQSCNNGDRFQPLRGVLSNEPESDQLPEICRPPMSMQEEAGCDTLGNSDRNSEVASGLGSHMKSNALRTRIRPFRRMVRELHKLLSHAAVIDIAELTNQSADFRMKLISEVDNPFQLLMAKLESDREIHEQDVDLLEEVLQEIGAKKALQVVHTYKESLSSMEERLPSASEMGHLHDISNALEKPLRVADEKNGQHEQELPPSAPERQDHLPGPSHTRVFNHGCDIACSWNDVTPILESFGISQDIDKLRRVWDSISIKKIDIDLNVSRENVVMTFLNRLMSYDYRSVRLFKDFYHTDNQGESELNTVCSNRRKAKLRLSCRDTTYAIINSSDEFLRQIILTKMSSCQLAVPLLLPDSKQNVLILLWGLQNVTKAWKDVQNGKILEETVVDFPFPSVTAVRYGNPGISKSEVLNNMLGPVQENDSHPYFTSRSLDSKISHISQGTVEALWYLPDDGKIGQRVLNNATVFLNVRGDAELFGKQISFASQYSSVMLVFVNSSDMVKQEKAITELSKKSTVILVLNDSENLGTNEHNDERFTRMNNVISFDASNLSLVEIAEYLCVELNNLISRSKKPGKSLASLTTVCEEIGITVDSANPQCSRARKSAEYILKGRENSKEYKRLAHPLQSVWRTWTELDRDKSWKGASGNIERELDKLHQSKKEERRKQRDIGMSSTMEKLYTELLDPSDTYIHYLVFWLNHLLNKTSLSSLQPLLDAQKEIRDKLRDTNRKISECQRYISNSDHTTDLKHDGLKELKDEENTLQITLKQKAKEIDDSSLGFEHFVREFGQLYECLYESEVQAVSKSSLSPNVDVNFLARVVGKLLLSGHPLEIFDGDACHVPVQWLQGVLSAVKTSVGDSSIYVISVIGIQSSGKSTLLNSMFGVSFPVSAGRCTRGVFLQLLPVAVDVKELLGIDFVAVIDTEGLKAPEKAISDRKNEDNELATFALCLSDMTLLNIGGQTVGEDLSNILQISAHAFIRMKEVNLRSSCYLIQQFVADITAAPRNESSTLSILQSLDNAVRAAAIEERKEDQYMQFSDCFNIVNINRSDDDVQYIPGLWRSNMLAPNHEYSKTVLKLKSAVLKQIMKHQRSQTLSEFGERIKNVWEAVREEDFVFNFTNTTEISQYNRFTQMYQKKQLLLTEELVRWELEAKQKIRNSTVENLNTRLGDLLTEFSYKLATESKNIRSYIEEVLRERDYESVRAHVSYFYRDLDCIGKDMERNIQKMLQLEVDAISEAKAKETQIVPNILADLRKQVLPLAEKVKSALPRDDRYSDDTITGVSHPLINEVFEKEWTRQMTALSVKYPVEQEQDITQGIHSDIMRCIVESLSNTGLSKGMKDLLSSRQISAFCEYTPLIESSKDIMKAMRLTGPCHVEMTRNIDNLFKTCKSACTEKEFKFSDDFALCLKEALTEVVSTFCDGCGNKKTLLICVCCGIVKYACDVKRRNILHRIMKDKTFLRKCGLTGIVSEEDIIRDVSKCKSLTKSNPPLGVDHLSKLLGKLWPPWSTKKARKDEESILSDIRELFINYLEKKGESKWYSHNETKGFIEIVKNVLQMNALQDFNGHRERKIMDSACSFYIELACESEMNALEKQLPWLVVQTFYKIGIVSVPDHMNAFVSTLEDTIPQYVAEILVTLSEDDIEKYSLINPLEGIRHSIDLRFLQLVPALDRSHFEKMFSLICNHRRKYVQNLNICGTYSAIFIRSLLTDILQELDGSMFGKEEQTVLIAHLCSWAFMFSVDVHCKYVQENCVQALVEKEKDTLRKDFELLCQGACMDHLAARSVYSVVEQSLKGNLENKVFSSLFQRLLSSFGDIFCSRSRFLKTVLEDLCQKEIFENYPHFLHHHVDFIEKWTLEFVADKCTGMSENNVSIEDIVNYEINDLVRKADESFEATFRKLAEESTQNDINFTSWIHHFSKVFEKTVGTTLHEKSIKDLLKYVKLTNISEFTDECKKILNTTAAKALLDNMDIPDQHCKGSVRNWISGLPKSIEAVLAKSVQGCGNSCPFCGTFCDDTVKEHEIHFSNLHYPRGVGGGRYKLSGRLVCDTCTALVASEREYYHCKCGYDVDCDHPTTQYKDYEVHYPNWDIQPIKDYQPTLYWKWVLTRFNEEFADYYGCSPAQIPWSDITKQEALNSIRN